MTETCVMHTIEIINACVIPLLTVFAGWLGYRQYQLSKKNHSIDARTLELQERNLKLNFYERRYRIFDETRSILRKAVQKGGLELMDFKGFYSIINESKFLFHSDIPEFLYKLVKTANHAKNTREMITTGNKDIIDENSEAFKWLVDEDETIEKRFMKYLDFRDV